MINPKTQSPAQGFYHSIVGYEDLANGKSQELSGVTAPDEYAVQIKLSKPDATMLHVLALNFSSVVPKEAVQKWANDFGHHPVGCGPFKLKEWTLGQRLVIERNPDYFISGIPYLDKITIQIGLDPSVALLKLQKGEVDILGDFIPPARFTSIINDPGMREQVVSGSDLQLASHNERDSETI